MVVVKLTPPLSFFRKVIPGGLLLRRIPKPSSSFSISLLWEMGFRQSSTIRMTLHVLAVEMTCETATMTSVVMTVVSPCCVLPQEGDGGSCSGRCQCSVVLHLVPDRFQEAFRMTLHGLPVEMTCAAATTVLKLYAWSLFSSSILYLRDTCYSSYASLLTVKSKLASGSPIQPGPQAMCLQET